MSRWAKVSEVRMNTASRFRLFLILGATVVACDRRTETVSDSTRAALADPSAASEPAAKPAGPAVSCPRTGRWAICSVEKRLEQSGFVARKVNGDNPRRLGFTVAPVVYALGRARLEIFLYPDEAALARDLTGLDTTIVAPRGKENDWQIPPRFVRSENLIAVFLTRNEQQAERLTLALTAGPPQR